jgi:hypothetical protein
MTWQVARVGKAAEQPVVKKAAEQPVIEKEF